ncbi:YbdK family carboxylate-amine ligase [Thermodesulfobacteriota bacterium]
MKPFVANLYPTLGVEEEFVLVDPETAELCPRVDAVMQALDTGMRERVCYELLECVLENRTGVCRTADELMHGVQDGRSRLAATCSSLGIALAASGSHAFGRWQDMAFADSDHYRWVRDHYGYIAHRLLSFGLHIHVGVQSVEAAMYIMHEMRRWAYPLLALSANSPYFEGRETGLASTRTHLFNSMPRTRFAPYFPSFSELRDYYEKLLETGDITRPGDLWWCIRPVPPLGTVEFRFLDLPTSTRRLGAFAAIVQAAVATYQDAFLAGRPESSLYEPHLDQNWWRALKDGLRADIIEPETGEVLSVRKQVRRLIDFVRPRARELKSEQHLDYALAMLAAGSESEQQIKLCSELGGDLRRLTLKIAQQTLDFS